MQDWAFNKEMCVCVRVVTEFIDPMPMTNGDMPTTERLL